MQRNGRPGFMDRVITLYLQTASELIAELKAASATNEPALLHRVSHTLKPCSATVGALTLAALCESLEQMARSGSVPDLAARIACYRRGVQPGGDRFDGPVRAIARRRSVRVIPARAPPRHAAMRSPPLQRFEP